jgi:hypothetical protein
MNSGGNNGGASYWVQGPRGFCFATGQIIPYYVSLLVLFGAEVTRAYVLRAGSRVVPLRHARWVGEPVAEKLRH